MTDATSAKPTGSDITNLNERAGELFAGEWRNWRAGWEQWLTRPFGWLAAVSVNWLDENPRNMLGSLDCGGRTTMPPMSTRAV
jgi:hypothetical protein